MLAEVSGTISVVHEGFHSQGPSPLANTSPSTYVTLPPFRPVIG